MRSKRAIQTYVFQGSASKKNERELHIFRSDSALDVLRQNRAPGRHGRHSPKCSTCRKKGRRATQSSKMHRDMRLESRSFRSCQSWRSLSFASDTMQGPGLGPHFCPDVPASVAPLPKAINLGFLCQASWRFSRRSCRSWRFRHFSFWSSKEGGADALKEDPSCLGTQTFVYVYVYV